eukprot:Hpha_TRINITY_DN15335_c1_g2::TRINITY_DN15335_c1_g2_i12::g.91800::m.91800
MLHCLDPRRCLVLSQGSPQRRSDCRDQMGGRHRRRPTRASEHSRRLPPLQRLDACRGLVFAQGGGAAARACCQHRKARRSSRASIGSSKRTSRAASLHRLDSGRSLILTQHISTCCGTHPKQTHDTSCTTLTSSDTPSAPCRRAVAILASALDGLNAGGCFILAQFRLARGHTPHNQTHCRRHSTLSRAAPHRTRHTPTLHRLDPRCCLILSWLRTRRCFGLGCGALFRLLCCLRLGGGVLFRLLCCLRLGGGVLFRLLSLLRCFRSQPRLQGGHCTRPNSCRFSARIAQTPRHAPTLRRLDACRCLVLSPGSPQRRSDCRYQMGSSNRRLPTRAPKRSCRLPPLQRLDACRGLVLGRPSCLLLRLYLHGVANVRPGLCSGLEAHSDCRDQMGSNHRRLSTRPSERSRRLPPLQ